MEKFGIFELLDTLSAIVEEDGDKKEAENQEKADPSDKAFAPPDYPAAAQGERGEALSSFLTRHEEIVKRIDKKK